MMHTKNVDEYIALAAQDIQGRLLELRAVIRKIAPKAEEKISYGMPFYEYKGRLVYFGVQKQYIGLYIPPPIIKNHAKELKGFFTTKSAIHLSNDKTLPIALIKKLVKARMKHNENAKRI